MTYELIMVTDFPDYWRDGQEASYPGKMFKKIDKQTSQEVKMFQKDPTIDDLQPFNKSPTTFIKIPSKYDQKADKAWIGTVSGFRVDKTDKGKFWFKVHLESTKEIDELEKEIWFSGCNVFEAKEQGKVPDISNTPIQPPQPVQPSIVSQSSVSPKSQLRPPFFDNFLLKPNTSNGESDWKNFELYVHLLVRLLGVHQADKFPSEAQAGKTDGFFRIGNLAVMWDATVNTEFKVWKAEQIKNYYRKLFHDSSIDLPTLGEITFTHCEKQVWIVTRSEISHLIKLIDGIRVKEVGVRDLIEIYEDRLRDGFDESDLANKLSNIGI